MTTTDADKLNIAERALAKVHDLRCIEARLLRRLKADDRRIIEVRKQLAQLALLVVDDREKRRQP
jgi:hypothetical protein